LGRRKKREIVILRGKGRHTSSLERKEREGGSQGGLRHFRDERNWRLVCFRRNKTSTRLRCGKGMHFWYSETEKSAYRILERLGVKADGGVLRCANKSNESRLIGPGEGGFSLVLKSAGGGDDKHWARYSLSQNRGGRLMV